MYITRYVLLADVLEKEGNTLLALSPMRFGALVLSALLITAAGNVINDYFDQKVDKINKPDKVIVGKSVNRKVAILIHQGMNLLALGLVVWVSIQVSFWQLLILPLLIMVVFTGVQEEACCRKFTCGILHSCSACLCRIG
jgi:4-hydroxybenzoate polyprenyltransferase